MPTTDKELLKAQFFFNYVEKMDAVIQKSQDGLYKKVKDTTTIIISLMTILFGLGNFIIINAYGTTLLLSIGVSLIFLLLSAVKGGLILWDNYSKYDDPLLLIQKYHKQTPRYVVMIVASTWADAVNKNRDFYNDKAKGYKSMLVLLGLGLAVLVLAFWIQFIQLYDC